MTDQPTNIQDTQRRFQEARDRYRSMSHEPERVVLDGDRDNNSAAIVNILDYLKDSKDKTTFTPPRAPVVPVRMAANQNKPNADIPIPLPVRPVDPESIIAQNKTNQLVEQRNKNIQKNKAAIS